MADANTVITNLGQQVAQLSVDKAILQAEVAELRAALAGPAAAEEPAE